MSWLNLSEVKESSFEQITPGQYFVQVTGAEVKQTRSGTGEYINAKFLIREGKFEDRHIFHSFNIKNDNPKAVEIGMSQLKSFLVCAGKKDFNLNSVADLVGLSAVAMVKIKSDPDYGDKAVIHYFKPTEETDVPHFSTSTGKQSVPFG